MYVMLLLASDDSIACSRGGVSNVAWVTDAADGERRVGMCRFVPLLLDLEEQRGTVPASEGEKGRGICKTGYL